MGMRTSQPRPHQRAADIPTSIGFVKDLAPGGVYVVSQRTPDDRGGTWEIDQVVVSASGQVETMRGNNRIDYSFPVFFRPNFVADILLTFGD